MLLPASLGKMLIRMCQREGIPLINIDVRKEEQVETLLGLGATHILNSRSSTFESELKQLAGQLRCHSLSGCHHRHAKLHFA